MQRMMNNVLSGLTSTGCFVFLDGIVICANSLVDHGRKLRDVFRRLRKYDLKLHPDKCEFLRMEVTSLGHKISELGVEPDASKIDFIKNFPTPKTVERLMSFLGLAGYYRYVVRSSSKVS